MIVLLMVKRDNATYEPSRARVREIAPAPLLEQTHARPAPGRSGTTRRDDDVLVL